MVTTSKEQTDLIFSDWSGVLVPGFKQSLQEWTVSPHGEQNRFLLWISPFLIILRLIGWGLRDCGSGCEGVNPQRTLLGGRCALLKGPLIRPVVRSDKKASGPSRGTGKLRSPVTGPLTPSACIAADPMLRLRLPRWLVGELFTQRRASASSNLIPVWLI